MSEATQEPQTETTEPTPDTEQTPDTEPVTEPQEPTEAPAEVEEPEPIEGPDETEPEPERAPDAPLPAMTEAEHEKRAQRLEAENVRHAKRVSEIMEEDATHLIGCPVCMDGIAGWIFPPEVQQLPDEAIARIRQVIGLPDYSSYVEAKDAAQCPDCAGLGKVKTGSAVPTREVKECSTCSGAGWINLGRPTNGHVEHSVAVQEVTGPTVYGDAEPDDRVRSLREEGYTVIPGFVARTP
jgi:hypothetical protein